MGIGVQKSALPTLFHFARVRAASQPHVLAIPTFLNDEHETNSYCGFDYKSCFYNWSICKIKDHVMISYEHDLAVFAMKSDMN